MDNRNTQNTLASDAPSEWEKFQQNQKNSLKKKLQVVVTAQERLAKKQSALNGRNIPTLFIMHPRARKLRLAQFTGSETESKY